MAAGERVPAGAGQKEWGLTRFAIDFGLRIMAVK
jgi:hypothetical protein